VCVCVCVCVCVFMETSGLRVHNGDYEKHFYEWGKVNYGFVRIQPNRRGCSSRRCRGEVIITVIMTAQPANISCHGRRGDDGRPQCCETAVEKLLFCVTKYTHGSVWSAVHSHSVTPITLPSDRDPTGKSAPIAYLGFRVSLASKPNGSQRQERLASRRRTFVVVVVVS